MVTGKEAYEHTGVHDKNIPLDFPVTFYKFLYFCRKYSLEAPGGFNWHGFSVGFDIDDEMFTEMPDIFEAAFQLDPLVRCIAVDMNFLTKEESVKLQKWKPEGVRTVFFGEEPPSNFDIFERQKNEAIRWAKKFVYPNRQDDYSIPQRW